MNNPSIRMNITGRALRFAVGSGPSRRTAASVGDAPTNGEPFAVDVAIGSVLFGRCLFLLLISKEPWVPQSEQARPAERVRRRQHWSHSFRRFGRAERWYPLRGAAELAPQKDPRLLANSTCRRLTL